jgi:hypothetical protein
MQGSFRGATLLMMGCEGLKSPALGEAFLARGASHYVGWNRTVTASETDAAALTFLRKLPELGEPLTLL